MLLAKTLLCPRCDSAALQKIGERRGDLGGFFGPAFGGPKQTIYAYSCECGITFSHYVEIAKAALRHHGRILRGGL